MTKILTRKDFIRTTSGAVAGSMLINPLNAFSQRVTAQKTKLALVGTGVRGTSFWGRNIQQNYSDVAEFVGIV